MDEMWERAVEAALEGQTDSSTAPRTLTLDGAVKCLHGRLPPPGLLERFQSLEHLSIANVGVSSLEKFPRLRNLQRLILSDNRIAGGLEFLVEAGLEALRDLDLSNNRIQYLEDLAPLAQLRLVSLDLYECPVTRVKDYRSRVFGMIRSLKYLDKMDADENERPETDDEEEDEDEEEEDEDPVSGEVEGEDRARKVANGARASVGDDGIIDADDDEESDADEEAAETGRRLEVNGHHSNGFHVAPVRVVDVDEDDEDVDDEDDDVDLGEEVDEEDGEDDDVVEVHEIEDSDDEDEDVLEEDDEEIDDEDGEDEEDVEDEDDGEPGSTGRMGDNMEGEIDGHEHGEEGDEDENGEIGEEDEQGVEDGDGEDEEDGTEFLVQPIPQVENNNNACSEEDESEEEVDDVNQNLSNGNLQDPLSSSSPNKRKRDGDEDNVEHSRSSKHH